MSEHYAEVNGIRICYEIKGEGYPVFLIHGFASKKESWLPQFSPLSKYFKVIRYDNRGSGASDRPDHPYTMELLADDLNGLMGFLKIEKAHIIGQSFGGMIAQHFAVKYQHRVKKLVLINTIAKWPEDKSGLEVYINGQITKYDKRLKDPVKTFFDSAPSGYTLRFRRLMKEDIKKKFFGLFSTEDLIKNTTFRPATPKDIKNQGHALGTHNILDRLPEIKNETLIMCASKDRQMPKSGNQKIHERIPNSKFIVIEDAGHGSTKEKAPEVNQNIINFLKHKKRVKNLKESYAEVNKIKICYEEKGEGDPVILVHGFGGKKEGWIGQWEPLSEYFRVIRFDNRNGGKSDRPSVPNSLDMLADDVKGLMDYLRIEKANIIGWSMGGIIVQKLAIKYPNRIKKLVLINTVMGAPDKKGVEIIKNNYLEELEQRKEDIVKAFWKSARLGYHIKFRKEMEANPKKKFYGLWSVEDLIKYQNLNPLTPEDIINQSYALFPPNNYDELKQIRIQTLLIASSHDRLTSSKSMIEMHQAIPNCTLKMIENAGHNSPLSRAPEVNKAIIEFLQE